jgi:FkbM family methyltransferase
MAFHIRHRIWLTPAVYPFVNNLHFITKPGMGYIAHNIYVGLYDFEEMGFLLHFLRPEDTFIDVGANAGAYTLLAAGGCGARVVAVEPVPATCALLRQNIALNGLEEAVNVQAIGLGAAPDQLYFSVAKADAWNHVVLQPDGVTAVQSVEVVCLDSLTATVIPALLKIDVEGYEYEVLAGAQQTLQAVDLKAVIVELNDSGRQYGHTDQTVHKYLIQNGFYPYTYDPLHRTTRPLPDYNRQQTNTLYLRDVDFVQRRIATAPAFRVLNQEI